MQALQKLQRLLAAATLVALFLPLRSLSAQRFAATDFASPDFFPILPWDPLHGWNGKAADWTTNGLETIADCNFNMAGFVWPEDLPKCRKLGLGAIVLSKDHAVGPPKSRKDWKALSDEEIDRRIVSMIKAAGSSLAIMGYFIMDEPGVDSFPALGKAVAAVKKHAPGKLAYINLFPDYATLGAPNTSQLGTSNYTEYLERFVAEVNPQVLSYDNYMVQYSDDLKNLRTAASYFRNLLEVRRVAQRHGLPCLHIVAANQLRPAHTIPSPDNLAFQAYTTLAAGFRGVTWYNYYGRGYRYAAIGQDGKKTLTWPWLKEINRQIATLAPVLRRLSSTGVYFTTPPPVEGLPALPGNLVESLASPVPMMVGEFSGPGGEHYALLVNLSLERSASFELRTKAAASTLSFVSPVDGALRSFSPGRDGYWLPAGQGLLLKIE
jgi:hypothetical protein